jgi:curved DNA-binding protein CbpA
MALETTDEINKREFLAHLVRLRMKYYETLGVPKTATQAEIKLAYKRAAALWHPDRAIEQRRQEYTEKFQDIAVAYGVLGDPEKRATYDGHAHAPGLVSQASVDAKASRPSAAGPCDICGGSGSVRTPDLSEQGRILFWSNKPCPRGCKGAKK